MKLLERFKKPVEKIDESAEIDQLSELSVFLDTRALTPGMTVYVVVPFQPNEKIPYAFYIAEPRIITQMYDNGVNGGTTFGSFRPYVSSKIGNCNEITVCTKEESFNTPYTKEQAEFIAKTLTEQSRAVYEIALKHMQEKQDFYF